ncbi:hypothetical protein FE810_16775 [Thalassotalea litorea]|uniref:Uncharacterized protein n=1 Tax=Thalassotalea litorea TaxID=2020715 RepID=A0A5R9IE78_9GAMM|nr:hypothetical protein [Thalassotalea litorea]TLU59494.1 hypothetical protein FE810_16775 [Thalassotalea litorea]
MINAAKKITNSNQKTLKNTGLATRNEMSVSIGSPVNNVLPFPASYLEKQQSRSITCTWKDVYQRSLIQHKCDKWVMVVNANKAQLKALSILDNTVNLLSVNPEKEIEFSTLIATLKCGNCASMIITNRQFSEQQLRLLTITAAQNDCQCIVIEKELNLH